MNKLLQRTFVRGSFWSFLTVFASNLVCAQEFEDKSYLKKNVPDANAWMAEFVPSSKYGDVVSFYNLKEALQNPEHYKSARFNGLGLTEFPEELFSFTNLEEIDISRNALTTLPDRLNEFKNLKELHVNKNQLTQLGTEITNCIGLEVLQIQHNPLKIISTQIGTMAALREITIGEVAEGCIIPLELWTLKDIRKIKITNAYLTEIPAAIGELKQLDAICLTNNALKTIPKEFYTLENITYANFGYNNIASLSEAINHLQKLNYLGIYYNPIASLPQQIVNLKDLTYLSCWKTNISQIEIDNARNQLPKTHIHNTEKDLH